MWFSWTVADGARVANFLFLGRMRHFRLCERSDVMLGKTLRKQGASILETKVQQLPLVTT